MMKYFLYITFMLSVLLTACGVSSDVNPTAAFTASPQHTASPTLPPTATQTSTPTPTATPNATATQEAQATQAADSVLTELNKYLSDETEVDYKAGHLIWQQTDPVTINLSG